MAEYLKIWTSLRGEAWFQALSCLERGMWLQGLIEAKNAGDIGDFSVASLATLSRIMACDDTTCAKNLRKFADMNLWRVSYGPKNIITVSIHNYSKWQAIKSTKEYNEQSRKRKRDGEKSPENRAYRQLYKQTDTNSAEKSPSKDGQEEIKKEMF